MSKNIYDNDLPKNIYDNDLPKDVKFEHEIAIDTEAMGLNTKRDRLCVVQIADKNGKIYIVKFDHREPFCAPNLCAVLQNKKIMKIFHFARFDIAIMKQYLHTEINNIYCTKIASRLARTYTDRHSLQELCSEILHIKLNKQQQSSDWGRESLTEKQCNYAASDVKHLIQIKNQLNVMLMREKRTELFQGCLQTLQNVVDLDLAGWTMEELFNHH